MKNYIKKLSIALFIATVINKTLALEIRPFTEADFPEVEHLIKTENELTHISLKEQLKMFKAMGPKETEIMAGEPTPTKEPVEDKLANLTTPSQKVFVATRDDKIVGVVSYQLSMSQKDIEALRPMITKVASTTSDKMIENFPKLTEEEFTQRKGFFDMMIPSIKDLPQDKAKEALINTPKDVLVEGFIKTILDGAAQTYVSNKKKLLSVLATKKGTEKEVGIALIDKALSFAKSQGHEAIAVGTFQPSIKQLFFKLGNSGRFEPEDGLYIPDVKQTINGREIVVKPGTPMPELKEIGAMSNFIFPVI